MHIKQFIRYILIVHLTVGFFSIGFAKEAIYTRIRIEVPERISKPYFVQLFSTKYKKVIFYSSELNVSTNTTVTIEREGNNLMFAQTEIDLCRFIQPESLLYKDFKISSFEDNNHSTLVLHLSTTTTTNWLPIHISKEFTIKAAEANTPFIKEFVNPFMIIRGLPRTYYSHVGPKKNGLWYYKVKGIYYTDERKEQYRLDYFYSNDKTRAGIGIDIKQLEECKFEIKDEFYRGD